MIFRVWLNFNMKGSGLPAFLNFACRAETCDALTALLRQGPVSGTRLWTRPVERGPAPPGEAKAFQIFRSEPLILTARAFRLIEIPSAVRFIAAPEGVA